jgi:transglutaminase-like putative cysteine protease
MDRSVACRMEAEITAPSDVVLSVALAMGIDLVDEHLRVTLDGAELPVTELLDDHDTRLHTTAQVPPGHLEVEYRASSTGRADPPPVHEVDVVRYLRPSRYCESDRLTAFARYEFGGLEGLPLLESVSSWVGMRVAYIAGASRPTDGAVTTLLTREGVCRDFAHLVIAMLRACDMPARLVSVYAPGLQPMDFHAVAEAAVDGQWLVADATTLAPRTAMLRIATGRDAADTAFLTTTGTSVELTALEVTAVTEAGLPVDDVTQPAQLG